MKFEIVMTNDVTVVHDVDCMTLEEFVNILFLAKLKKGFTMLKTTNDTDIAINVDRVITVRKVR